MVLNKKQHICHECGGKLIKTASDYVCNICGLVHNRLYKNPNYQAIETAKSYGSVYTSTGKKTVKGTKLGTCLGEYGKKYLVDHAGKSIKVKAQAKYHRYKRIQDYYVASNDNDRAYRATKMLNSVIGILELPEKVQSSAFILYNKVSSENVPKIRMIDMVTAAIYLAIRLERYNLRVKEIIKAVKSMGHDISGRKILAAAAIIKKKTQLKVRTVKPEGYVERVIQTIIRDEKLNKKLKSFNVSKNNYEKQLRKLTRQLLDSLNKGDRGGRNPFALACATIAGADILIGRRNGRRRGFTTQKRIANLNKVAEFTLREHYLVIIKPNLKKVLKEST